jgi:hypothetical protein
MIGRMAVIAATVGVRGRHHRSLAWATRAG